MIEFVINAAFSDKLPKLTDAEFNQLRDNILEEKVVRRPLVVWYGALEGESEKRYYLIDGHNRWAIIQENWELLKDKYKVEAKEFENQYYAEAWMYRNQRGQRNLSDLWQEKINGEIVKAEIKAVGGQSNNKNAKKRMVPSDPIVSDGGAKSTVERVAKELNVPEGTLKKQLQFVRGLDATEKVDPSFQNEVLSGEIKTSKKSIRELRLKEPGEIKNAIEEIRNPKPKAISNPNIPKKERIKKSDEDREIEDRVSKILEMQKDNAREAAVTIEDLVEMITADGEDYATSLKNTLVVRSTLLVGENREKVAAAINSIIEKISKLKELLE